MEPDLRLIVCLMIELEIMFIDLTCVIFNELMVCAQIALMSIRFSKYNEYQYYKYLLILYYNGINIAKLHMLSR